jgi:hypothetical protein
MSLAGPGETICVPPPLRVPPDHGSAQLPGGDSACRPTSTQSPKEGRMDPWIAGARRILERSPTGAAPLSRLLAQLGEEGVEVEGREPWILKRLSEQPRLFRVLPKPGKPFRGCPPFPLWEPDPHRARGGLTEPTPHQFRGGLGEPWVLASSTSAPRFGSGDKAVGRIQETLGAWGRSLDEESPRAVARWIQATLEAEGACSHFLTEEGMPT